MGLSGSFVIRAQPDSFAIGNLTIWVDSFANGNLTVFAICPDSFAIWNLTVFAIWADSFAIWNLTVTVFAIYISYKFVINLRLTKLSVSPQNCME